MEKDLQKVIADTELGKTGIFAGTEIEGVRYYTDRACFEIDLHTKRFLSFQENQALCKWFRSKLSADVCLHLNCADRSFTTGELQNYLNSWADVDHQLSLFNTAGVCYEENESRLRFLFASQAETEKGESALSELRQHLAAIGLSNLGVVCEYRNEVSNEIADVKMDIIPPKDMPEPKVHRKGNYYKKKLDSYTEVALKDAQDNTFGIQFKGKIFAKDDFTSKTNGRIIQSLSVYDGNDAIVVKRFEGKHFSKEDLAAVNVGETVRVYGSFKYDSFAKDVVCEADAIVPLEEKSPADEAKEKRVELHMHTNMSEMDGVCEAEAIVRYAWDIGHEGIVITDHADVQSFVKAFNAADKLKAQDADRPFKIGLGCEMNLVDDRLTIVRNSVDTSINDAEYIAFDLETTGLSCYFDSIIEFGAVRMKNQTVVERKQMFIKPPKPIPSYITAKTNITNDMVRDAPSFAEAADELLAWIGDGILVAHNATFDYYFMNEELRRIGRPPLTNTVIDTLDLSRAVLKDRRAYRLGNISRYYHIAYDEEVAHRADYDAEALSNVLLCLLKDAGAMGAKTISDLQEKIQGPDIFRKVRHSHTMVLVKNKAGLKTLYQLVTMSNTETLAVMGKASGKEGAEITAEPRILRSVLNSQRENLLIGTSCQNNEVFELACNGDDERLEKAIKWYDYVEIQPLSCYTTLVAIGNVPNMERVKQALQRIIGIARKLNIPVVADSDAHYCSKDQKIFRDVYIMSQGVGGVTHPLYIRDDAVRMRTANPDQHIYFTDEMLEAFAWLNDPVYVREIVIRNPHKIFDMLEAVRPVPSGTYPPHIEGSDEKLKSVCYETAKKTYEFEGQIPQQVSSRLDRELKLIINAGYYVNYYISHLLVKKSNADGYMVGSRGSVGSSFTATMAGITEVNPLAPHYLCPNCHYSEWPDDLTVKSGFDLPDKICPHCGALMTGNGNNIPFETFLGFNGDKVPDIDLNFSNEYQAKAHAFTKEVFGEDHVFRAGTIGTVAEKTAFGYVSGYCEKMGITNMRRPMKEYLASGCQNVKRTTGQHPGGIIVIPDEYTAEDFTPVQYPANDPNSEWKTTHYDFHDIHDNVLKFDILGHVDPTAMRLLTSISETDPRSIPMNDPETLSLFYSDQALRADPRIYHKETGALGLPEFGTRITRRVLEQTRPHTFSDLVIISGLTHGRDVWAGNAESLVEQGHPLEEVIGCRDDIMTYLLGMKLEPIDAFKIMEDVRKGRGLTEKQEATMREHHVPDWYIESCKKIKYMFPKAHAVAYVMMAVRIAWYKVHEPHNFYIQFLTLRCDDYEIETMTKGLDAIRDRMLDIQTRIEERNPANPVSNKEKSLLDTLEVCEEIYARGYRIGRIDLYKSKATEFTVEKGNEHLIIAPFTAIDGLGVNVARSIEAARRQGDFLSKEDLMARTQLSANLVRRLEVMGCLSGLQDSNQMSLF